MAIWPWAEANQGLLSVAALVVALFFALYENRRANRAGIEERHEYVDVVMSVITELEAIAASAGALSSVNPLGSAAADEWNSKVIAPRFMLDSLRRRSIADAKLAIAVNRLWYSLGMTLGGYAAPGAPNHLTAMEDLLRTARNEIAPRR